ncbi:MAG: protoporphyrinogen/coproporphyrinogen oxidase [Caldisphaera sp.]
MDCMRRMNIMRKRSKMANNLPTITILGAGLSGISVAYHYLGKSIIYDKLDKIGGTASTENYNGFLYDRGPHVLFTKDTYIINLLSKNTPVFKKVAKPMNIFKGKEFPHPALFNLYRLPKEERYKILLDFIEAYKNFDPNYRPMNYKDWCIRTQGKYFTENYSDLYTRKFWCTDSENLTTEWIQTRIPIPSIQKALEGAFGLNEKQGYYFDEFIYPKRGGFGSFSNFWQERSNDITIKLNKEVALIDTNNKSIKFKDGTYQYYNILISTIPLPELLNILPNMPNEIKTSVLKLKYTSLHYINILLKGKWKRDFTWLYFYDKDIPISRLIPYTKISPYMAPKGYTSLQIEIPYCEKFSKDFTEISLYKLQELGYIKQRNIIEMFESDLKYGYVIYNKDREENLKKILDYLKNIGIYSLGRYGSWEYLWSYQVIAQAKEFTEKISKNLMSWRQPK